MSLTKEERTIYGNFLRNIPKSYKEIVRKGFFSRERLDYHPEGLLGLHIAITVIRAMKTNNPNLIMIAALHDICKHLMPKKSKGGTRTVKISLNGEIIDCTYHSNPDHPYQAIKFIEDNLDIQNWIVSKGANIDLVKLVVGGHMNHKNFIKGVKGIKGGMKASKRMAYRSRFTKEEFYLLEEFSKIDDMLIEY